MAILFQARQNGLWPEESYSCNLLRKVGNACHSTPLMRSAEEDCSNRISKNGPIPGLAVRLEKCRLDDDATKRMTYPYYFSFLRKVS